MFKTNSITKKARWESEKYRNDPRVLSLPEKERWHMQYTIYWEDRMGMKRLSRAITLAACNELFRVFGYYDHKCGHSVLLGGSPRDGSEVGHACEHDCRPWILTPSIRKAEALMKEKMEICEETGARLFKFEEAHDFIVDEIEYEIMETALGSSEAVDAFSCQLDDFKIWIDSFYYEFSDWSFDYETIEDDIHSEYSLEETNESLRHDYR